MCQVMVGEYRLDRVGREGRRAGATGDRTALATLPGTPPIRTAILLVDEVQAVGAGGVERGGRRAGSGRHSTASAGGYPARPACAVAVRRPGRYAPGRARGQRRCAGPLASTRRPACDACREA